MYLFGSCLIIFAPKIVHCRHIWAHGDFIYVNKSTSGFVMLGRSDGTLNPNGVRFGSAEIYSILETVPEVTDSLCVGQVQ